MTNTFLFLINLHIWKAEGIQLISLRQSPHSDIFVLNSFKMLIISLKMSILVQHQKYSLSDLRYLKISHEHLRTQGKLLLVFGVSLLSIYPVAVSKMQFNHTSAVSIDKKVRNIFSLLSLLNNCCWSFLMDTYRLMLFEFIKKNSLKGCDNLGQETSKLVTKC